MRFKILLVISLLLKFQAGMGQKVPLEKILNHASKHNMEVKASQTVANYQQSMIETAKSIPKTGFELQYGNLQLANVADYSFTVVQPFNNPKLNIAKSELLKSYFQQALNQVEIKTLEINKSVRLAYYKSTYYGQLIQVLSREDSLNSLAFRKATIRYESGETSILEQVSIRNGKEANLNELQKAKKQYQSSILKLQQVSQWPSDSIEVDLTELESPLNLQPLTLNGPFHESFERMLLINEKGKALENAQLKPDFYAGLTNQSMDRFLNQFVVVGGINIPIFQKAEKAKIKAFDYQKESIRAQQQAFEVQVAMAYNENIAMLKAVNEEINYLKKTALPNAQLITSAALQQYLRGDIGYLEYQQNLLTAYQLKETFLSKLLEQKQIETELLYLLGK